MRKIEKATLVLISCEASLLAHVFRSERGHWAKNWYEFDDEAEWTCSIPMLLTRQADLYHRHLKTHMRTDIPFFICIAPNKPEPEREKYVPPPKAPKSILLKLGMWYPRNDEYVNPQVIFNPSFGILPPLIQHTSSKKWRLENRRLELNECCTIRTLTRKLVDTTHFFTLKVPQYLNSSQGSPSGWICFF